MHLRVWVKHFELPCVWMVPYEQTWLTFMQLFSTYAVVPVNRFWCVEIDFPF